MANRSSASSSNFKVFCRLRPIEHQQKMLQLSNDNTISIKDPSSKSKEKQTFAFNGTFDVNSSQESLWAHICEPCVQKVIEGHNSCIISYGQTGSGKTFSIFGQDQKFSINALSINLDGKKDQRGLVCRSVEYLFRKAQELEDIREFVITCSIAEIYLDQVRDLGKALGSNSEGGYSGVLNPTIVANFENQNLTIYENTNGQIVIQDLSQITLKTINDLYDLLSAAFQLREQFENKGTQIWARAHTIFTINVVQKDKENQNIPFMNSSIQFIDLAGSERIAKSLTEGHKFQQAILINSSLTALGQCLQSISRSNKNIPYRQSKLTRSLQNCMSISSQVGLIINLNPSESNYEECLSSLQFADRTKNSQAKANSNNGQDEFAMNMNSFVSGNDKLIKQLNDEKQDLKAQIQFIQREHKQKLIEIQNALGIEFDLDQVMSKAGQKDVNQFKMQKEALVQVENLTQYNMELEQKVEKLHQHIDDQVREEALQQEKYTREIIELKEVIKQMKEQLSVSKMQNDDQVKKLNHEREKELNQMIEKSNQLLEEKTSLLINLPLNIEKLTNENQQIAQIQQNTQLELEKQYKQQVDNIKLQYQKLLENATKQYEYLIKQKIEQLEEYQGQIKVYREKQKSIIDELQTELLDLYDIHLKQAKIIEKVENGEYSGGIRSFNIPNKDKPIYPNRNKHKNLFQFLDHRHLSTTSLSQDQANKDNQDAMRRTGMSDFRRSQITPRSEMHSSQTELRNQQPSTAPGFLKDDGNNSFIVKKEERAPQYEDLNVNINMISKDDFITLKSYAERLKESLTKALDRQKDLKQRLDQYNSMYQSIDVNALIKQKEDLKTKYMSQSKQYNQARVVLESQKRLLNFPQILGGPTQNNNFQNMARPHTVMDSRIQPSTSTGYIVNK